MGIESTRRISRDDAIKRITEVVCYVRNRNFRKLENADKVDPRDIREPDHFDVIEQWTNTMLGEAMDTPGYRWSIFDNYEVSEYE